jgi:hypothetical protein
MQKRRLHWQLATNNWQLIQMISANSRSIRLNTTIPINSEAAAKAAE